jgi:hypothetical protein
LGYFFHGKMPGCCLPSLTAATVLHVTADYSTDSLQQEPMPCFAFSSGNSPLPLGSTGAISLSWKKHPNPLTNLLKVGYQQVEHSKLFR